MKLTTVLLALALTTGCGKKKDAPAHGDPTCEVQAPRYAKVFSDALVKEIQLPADKVQPVIAAATESCKADGWTEKTLGCMGIAKDELLETCMSMNPPEVQKKFEERVKTVIRGKPAAPATAEAQMWELGDELALATLGQWGGAPRDAIDGAFETARQLADSALGVKLEPLPAPNANKAKTGADGFSYLLDGAGKTLAKAAYEKLGKPAGASLELAIKLEMLIALYTDDPADKMGTGMIKPITGLAGDAKLPAALYGPLVAKLEAHAPKSDVTSAIETFQAGAEAALARK